MRWLSPQEIGAISTTPTRLTRARSAVASGFLRGLSRARRLDSFRRRALVHSRTHRSRWYVVHLSVDSDGRLSAECACKVHLCAGICVCFFAALTFIPPRQHSLRVGTNTRDFCHHVLAVLLGSATHHQQGPAPAWSGRKGLSRIKKSSWRRHFRLASWESVLRRVTAHSLPRLWNGRQRIDTLSHRSNRATFAVAYRNPGAPIWNGKVQ